MSARNAKNRIGVGIIGFGTVGSGVAKILAAHADLIRRRVGVPIEVAKIADLDITADRGISLKSGILTTDVRQLIDDPGTDIVVELIGGLKPAGEFILAALANGKPVVTANKALLAVRGEEIYAAAHHAGLDVGVEASVGGGIPIIRALREGLAGDDIRAIYGIINGTANYILSKMSARACDFHDAVKEAQRERYAEADPSMDLEGIDSAHKLAILVTVGFGTPVRLSDIYTEGITSITSLDLEAAREFGYTVKLLGIAKWNASFPLLSQVEGDARLPRADASSGDVEIEARVHPTMIPEQSPLARVDGVYNAIHVIGGAIGDTMLYGRGAGSLPTASAVVADIIDISRNLLTNAGGRVPPMSFAPAFRQTRRIKPMSEVTSAYYVRFMVRDRPGVLSQLAGILGEQNISIASVLQRGRSKGHTVPVIMTTHEATERDVQTALQKIQGGLSELTQLIRIERERPE